jgi:nicotinamidase-related amidase
VNDALLLVDVLSDFSHDDGERLARSFADRLPALAAVVRDARRSDIPVVYANDHHGDWASDRASLIDRARRAGPPGDALETLLPRPGEPLLIKPRYSAFDHTAVEPLLHELGAERILLAGTALEMCVAQTAIDARELGLKVSVIVDACPPLDPQNADVALAYLERVAGAFLVRGDLDAALAA